MVTLALHRKINHLRGLALSGQATKEDRAELLHLQAQLRRTLVNFEHLHSLRRKWGLKRGKMLTTASSTKRMHHRLCCRRK